ncbi:MAG: hypothetical protein ABI905_11550 [Betaproteobacteria bacterium]
MHKKASRGPRLLSLFALGVLLFNYPLLALFNLPRMIFGVPVLYAYLFIAWALLIFLVARVVDRPDPG